MREVDRKLRNIVLTIGVAFFLTTSITALAGNGGIPPKMTAEWWQWAFSIPYESHPLTEFTGERCMVGQHGNIVFLGGSFYKGESPDEIIRDCTIPLGSTILMPVINAECSTAEGDANPDDPFKDKWADLKACARDLADMISDTEATFGLKDGIKKDLKVRRVTTPLPFTVSFPDDYVIHWVPELQANPSLSIADGYWVKVKPSKPGSYELKVHGYIPAYDWHQNITYNIEVVKAE